MCDSFPRLAPALAVKLVRSIKNERERERERERENSAIADNKRSPTQSFLPSPPVALNNPETNTTMDAIYHGRETIKLLSLLRPFAGSESSVACVSDRERFSLSQSDLTYLNFWQHH